VFDILNAGLQVPMCAPGRSRFLANH